MENQIEIYKSSNNSTEIRVNSKKGTQFRQWATQRLKDYLVNIKQAA